MNPPPFDLSSRTKAFARRIIHVHEALPSKAAAKIIGHQVLRSGTSIGANYREANRARSKAEFLAKIGDCLKEADETLYWLELLIEEKFLPPRKLSALLQEINELIAIFVTILKHARQH